MSYPGPYQSAVPLPSPLEQPEFGLPGEGLVSHQALDAMDEGPLLKGLVGEQKSAALFKAEIAKYQVSHAIQVVHGLRFPGTESADIDHALVCGDRVLLVDSKHWAPDSYRWYGESILAGPDDDPRLVRSNFFTAQQRFATLVTPAHVAAIILVHRSRPGDLSLDNTHAELHPKLVDADQGFQAPLGWLLQGVPIVNGTADWALFQHWQTATMTRVLEQKPDTPQARHRAARQALAEQLERNRLARIQRREDITQQMMDFRADRKRRKQNKLADEKQRAAAQREAERDRLQQKVLQQQRAINNQQLPFWKRR